ncbi:MAG: PIG-L family deacetylase [Actinomycetota bacterium]|nr:PIG-L family deacetylase [Actinomycetota bacterium]|tara:strand:- start:5368 stop:6189 length:822 start_codon:yes stop_codon:yes gene_type:complete
MATVVFFHAHPDDEALSTAGTMAALSVAEHRVILVVATRGEEGEPVPGVLREGELLEERRTEELIKSANLLGVERVEFLNYRDSGMADSPTTSNPECFWQADPEEATKRLGDILKDEKVDFLVIYDPNGGYGHPDHIQVHRVGTLWSEQVGIENIRWTTLNRDAIKKTIELAMRETPDEGLAGVGEDLEERKKRVEEGSFGSAEIEITHAIDVSDFIDKKRESISAHRSQIDENSFFLKIPDEQFLTLFGTEWFINPKETRKENEPFKANLFN